MPAPAGAIYLTDIGLPYKTFVGTGTPITKVLAADDFRYISVCSGLTAQVMEIPNYAQVPFSFDSGFPFFYLFRKTVGTIHANPPDAADLGTVANQAARLALSSATVGDYCYQTSTDLSYVLTTAGYSVNGNWTALPADAPGGVTIYNPRSRETGQMDPPTGIFCFAPNEWAYL